jgi:hypothetical protein
MQGLNFAWRIQPKSDDQPHVQRAVAQSAPRARVGFLFNHDATHQVAHSAPTINALLDFHSNVEIEVLVTSEALLSAVRAVCGADAIDRCCVVRLSLPEWQQSLARVIDAAVPLSRIETLLYNQDLLAAYDALVVPERTSLLLKHLPATRHVKLIHTKHGSGDRAQTFARALGKFDLLLLSGRKMVERLRERGILDRSQYSVVGYQKFEMAARRKPKKLFNNGRPTVIYNPHPHPALSSWFVMGRRVLDYFYNSDAFNLIFAPHLMLFKRRWHLSLRPPAAQRRDDLPEKYFTCPHMLIDLGSDASVDMTYTLAADIYVGDVSSQIYEFLCKPRPCVFLNPRGIEWRDNADYRCWSFGAVARTMEEFDLHLRRAGAEHPRYKRRQEEGFADTFSFSAEPAPRRAARAIAQFLEHAARPH